MNSPQIKEQSFMACKLNMYINLSWKIKAFQRTWPLNDYDNNKRIVGKQEKKAFLWHVYVLVNV